MSAKALASPAQPRHPHAHLFLIVFNWGFYVWSIEAGRTLESSLGYFINPLLNVVMGYLFLGERFTRLQMVALALAAVAVLIQTFARGRFPWLGLMLAATFCLYGFLRKTIPVGPTQGFLIEVGIIALPLAGHAVLAHSAWQGAFRQHAPTTRSMLIGCGVMTAIGADSVRGLDPPHPLFDGGAAAVHLAVAGVPDRRLHLRRAPWTCGSSPPSSSSGWRLRSSPFSALRDERSRRRSEEREPPV